jgi:hypothetical protein
MCSRLSPGTLTDLYKMARKDALGEVLSSFGEVVTGTPGFLVANGFVIYQGDCGTPIVGGDGTEIDPVRAVDCADLVVNHLGLCIGQVSASEPDRFVTSLAILAIRLGILSRILDMAYVHLKDRVSFGQKTLSHQLVKATFAEVHGAVIRLREQMRLRADRSLFTGVTDDHGVLSTFNNKAEKLMGGHGYLLTGTHPLSYLSMLLFSVYGAAQC